MIKICVCDDSVKDLERIEKLVEEFTVLYPDKSFTFHRFQSPYDLLDYMDTVGCFDVFLLDVIMPNINGIELGKKIREKKIACEIIYLTSSREYAVDAFAVEASNYLLKPIEKEAFDKALLCSLDKLSPAVNPSMILKVNNGILKIYLRDIVFIESFNYYRTITLKTGEIIKTEKTITALFEELKLYKNFQISHRAYIINLDYVTGLVNKSLLMLGGYCVPVSRNNYITIKNVYLKYTL